MCVFDRARDWVSQVAVTPPRRRERSPGYTVVDVYYIEQIGVLSRCKITAASPAGMNCAMIHCTMGLSAAITSIDKCNMRGSIHR